METKELARLVWKRQVGKSKDTEKGTETLLLLYCFSQKGIIRVSSKSPVSTHADLTTVVLINKHPCSWRH